jgi:hypothetical protein
MRVRAVSFGGGSYRGDGWSPFRFPGGEPQDPSARRFRSASAGGTFRGEATFIKLLSAPSGPLRGFGGGLIAVLEG